MKVIAYIPDLMDRSKFVGFPADVEVTFASTPAQLSGDADVFVADLKRLGVIEALSTAQGRKLGFISHVDDETRQRAVGAGIKVMARSAFFSRLVGEITKPE